MTAPPDDRMSDLDAILWAIEDEPRLRSTIVAVLELDHLPERAALVARIERAAHRVERLRCRVRVDPFAPPRWEPDHNFTLTYHLRWANLGGDATRRDLFDLAAPIAMQSFDTARPLWELTVVGGLAGGGAAVIAKLHHTLVDGVGGIELLLEVFDLEREAARGEAHEGAHEEAHAPAPAGAHEGAPGAASRVRAALLDELERRRVFALHTTEQLLGLALDPVDGLRRTLDTARSALRLAQPANGPISPLLTARSLSCSFDAIDRPLDAFRAAARTSDASINDVFVTGLCRGFARWHRAHGSAMPRLRMGMAISVRATNTDAAPRATPAPAPGANQFVPTRFEVPLDVADPTAHLVEVRELLRSRRHEPALALMEPLTAVARRLPRPVLTGALLGLLRGQDFVASNVPGAPVPIYLAGAQVTGVVAFGPLGGTACNITLLSHDGTAHVGINHDPVAIPDGAALVAALEAGLDEVLALGATTAEPARGPARPRRRR